MILAPRFATLPRAAAAAVVLYLLDDGWLECGRLGVEQIAEEPLPPPEGPSYLAADCRSRP